MAHLKRVINFSLFFYALFHPILQPMVAEFHPDRTISDSAGQMRTLLSAYPNIAYLVATFGRDYSHNH